MKTSKSQFFNEIHKLKSIIFFVTFTKTLTVVVGEFLQKHCPFINKSENKNLIEMRRNYISVFDDNFGRETVSVLSQCSAWFVLFQSKLNKSFRWLIVLPFCIYVCVVIVCFDFVCDSVSDEAQVSVDVEVDLCACIWFESHNYLHH